MAQYCRYCSHCIYGDSVYCDEKGTTMSFEQAKRTNKCKHFELNTIDALYENVEGYKPRKHKKFKGQMRLF